MISEVPIGDTSTAAISEEAPSPNEEPVSPAHAPKALPEPTPEVEPEPEEPEEAPKKRAKPVKEPKPPKEPKLPKEPKVPKPKAKVVPKTRPSPPAASSAPPMPVAAPDRFGDMSSMEGCGERVRTAGVSTRRSQRNLVEYSFFGDSIDISILRT